MSEQWPFVGRDGEIAAILGAVAADRPNGMVIIGPAGVGKSRLLRHVVGLLDPARHAVFAVAATAATAGIPLGAFADLLPPGAAVGTATSQLLRDAMQHLRSAAAGRRAVLIVDDLHLMDPLGATLIYYMARNSDAAVLATVRSGESTADTVSALWGEDLANRLAVTELDSTTTAELLARVLGGPVDQATIQRLWALTEGNALMLREVVTILRGSTQLTREAGQWRWTGGLPTAPSLMQLILDRIGDLPAPVRHVLELVTYGETLGLALVTAAAGAAAVEQAESAGLIRLESQGRRTAVSLAHPLHGEAVRQTTPTVRARARRAELIDLVRRTGALRRNDVLRLAVWSLDSSRPADQELMLAAARLAYVDLDMPLAARLAEAAGDSVDAVELQSYALGYVGRPERALEILDAVAPRFPGGWPRARLMAARDTLAFGGLGDGTTLSDEPAERIGVTDPAAAAWVAEHDLLRRLWSGQLNRARAGLDRSPAADDDPSRLLVDVRTACLDALEGRHQAALECTERMLARDSATIALPYLQVATTFIRSTACLVSGDLALLVPQLDDYERMGPARYFPLVDGQLALAAAAVSRLNGRLAGSVRMASEALACFAVSGQQYRPLAHVELAHAAALRGEPMRAAEQLNHAEATMGPTNRMLYPWVELARVQTAASAGRVSVATDVAVMLADRLRADGLLGCEVHAWYAVIRHAGANPDAVDRLAVLAEAVDSPLAAAAASHALALAADDVAGLLAAADNLARLGLSLYAAEAAGQAYTVARRADNVPDVVVEQLADLLEVCDAACTPALAISMPGLSDREREIADLAAAGLTSPQIARRLYLSPRTPDSHLQRIYGKFGVSGRVRLGAMLRLHRLLTDRTAATGMA